MKLRLKFPLPFVNGLRRSLISNIPSFSLNSTFIENETSYNDDILRLRISMIPVKEHIMTKLDKTNKTKNSITITSNDFDNNEHIMKDIYLFDLKPGQSINIECETEKGYGYQNARWQVIQTPIMKMIEDVKIKKQIDIEKIKTISPELIVNNKIDKEKCLIDRTAVERVNEVFENVISFVHQGEYELSFEADYYSEIYCLHYALENLKQIFASIDEEYELIHDPKMKILKFNKSHTFGNIMQYYLQQKCSFAAYTKDHYLNNYILVKFVHDYPKKILEEIREQVLQDLKQLEQFCIS